MTENVHRLNDRHSIWLCAWPFHSLTTNCHRQIGAYAIQCESLVMHSTNERKENRCEGRAHNNSTDFRWSNSFQFFFFYSSFSLLFRLFISFSSHWAHTEQFQQIDNSRFCCNSNRSRETFLNPFEILWNRFHVVVISSPETALCSRQSLTLLAVAALLWQHKNHTKQNSQQKKVLLVWRRHRRRCRRCVTMLNHISRRSTFSLLAVLLHCLDFAELQESSDRDEDNKTIATNTSSERLLVFLFGQIIVYSI